MVWVSNWKKLFKNWLSLTNLLCSNKTYIKLISLSAIIAVLFHIMTYWLILYCTLTIRYPYWHKTHWLKCPPILSVFIISPRKWPEWSENITLSIINSCRNSKIYLTRFQLSYICYIIFLLLNLTPVLDLKLSKILSTFLSVTVSWQFKPYKSIVFLVFF